MGMLGSTKASLGEGKLGNQSGSAFIEFAIVMPVFLFIIVAIVDFGLYFNKRNVAQSAAYNAAKACNKDLRADGYVIQANSPGYVTLETLKIATNKELKNSPTCSITANYYKVDMTIGGNLLSPLTSLLGLYDFTVTGIATKTNNI